MAHSAQTLKVPEAECRVLSAVFRLPRANYLRTRNAELDQLPASLAKADGVLGCLDDEMLARRRKLAWSAVRRRALRP